MDIKSHCEERSDEAIPSFKLKVVGQALPDKIITLLNLPLIFTPLNNSAFIMNLSAH